MSNIDEIMHLINWNQSSAEQARGISLARDIKCIKCFFQPLGLNENKAVWQNCAKVICYHDDSELELYLVDMLLWLEDINWPGSELILNRLIAFKRVDMLAHHLSTLVPVLVYKNEFNWLITLARLLENSLLLDTIDNETLLLLLSYQNRTTDESIQ